ncbi:hypothetical protein SUGI_0192600 [Cryptomeria japonica]|nr:hypothetical protein SUGI_0192600 [Cryptomeria japonica]
MILKLQEEKAKLLGYKKYAEVSMVLKMENFEKAKELLERLCSASWDSTVQHFEDLEICVKESSVEEANVV